uniref:Uncharacterized protein n=1 Tax=Solanum lycopersicum TaxID=4081 RepID=A0A3Q7GD01_SOLLC
MSPEAHIPPFRRFSCAIANNFLGDPDYDVKNSKILVDVRLDLGYAAGWISRPVQPNFKIPASKMPKFYVDVPQDPVYAYDWPSWSIRPILKVKRALKCAYPPLRRFSCSIENHFLGVPDSDAKNAEIFRGRPSRPWICSGLAFTASPTNLQGQTSPKARIPPHLDDFRVI